MLRALIKTEGRVALFEDAPAPEEADGVLERVLVVMLDDEDARGREQFGGVRAEEFERGQVVAVVGRIVEGDVVGHVRAGGGAA